MIYKYKLVYIKFEMNNKLASCIGVLSNDTKESLEIVFTADNNAPIDSVILNKNEIKIIEFNILDNRNYNIE